MKSGTIIKTFKSQKGREVTIRAIESGDVDGLLSYGNSLIAEDTTVLLSGEPLTREYEETYVKETLEKMEKDKKIHLVAIIDNAIAGSLELRRGERRKSHTADVGISILKEYRDEGIGKECLRTLIEEAKNLGLKLLTLTCFEINEWAMHLYESLGFTKAGMIPKALLYKGKYINEVIMYLPLRNTAKF